MNKISISEAARLAEISRTNLYKTYINTGKISVIRENDKVYIDASELIRVFPNCKLSNSNKEQELSNKDNSKIHDNSELVELLKAQLAEAQERENWLKQQIDELRHQQNHLLEDKRVKPRKKFLGIF
ncbi:MAG: hypothetical protein RL494_1164 [Bacteroidota bacterium]|jgi:hypothetical protein